MLEKGKATTMKNTLKDITNANTKGLVSFNLSQLQPVTENQFQEGGILIFQKTQPELSLKLEKQGSRPVKSTEWQLNTHRSLQSNTEPLVSGD